MLYGYCFLGCVPIRKKPISSSEQVSQLLFGDCFSIKEQININELNNCWTKIVCLSDQYEGWIDSRTFFYISEQEAKRDNQFLVSQFIAPIQVDNTIIVTPFGSKVKDTEFTLSNHKIKVINGQAITKPLEFDLYNLHKIAMNYINCPYQWGGKSIMGIDCSGLIQNIFLFFNYNLPRDAKQQAIEEQDIEYEQIKEGDLMFFGKDIDSITHVGICLEKNLILHSSAYVHSDKFDKKGIISSTNPNQHSHNFIKAIRIIH